MSLKRAISAAAIFSIIVPTGLFVSAAGSTAATSQVTFLSEDVPAGLDYDGPSAAIPASQVGMVNLMEPLVYYKKSGKSPSGVNLLKYGYAPADFQGRLAESFTKNGLVWTFKLRKNVVGCNGEKFTADDVIYTFARAKSVSGAAPIGYFLSAVGGIKDFATFDGKVPLGDEVKKIDDYTVQITQGAENKLFLPALTIFGMGMFDKEGMEAQKTAKDPWSHDYANTVNVPSFGPYCLSKWTKGSEFVLTANPKYYGGKPSVAKIVLRKVPQSANRLAAIRTGAAQLTERLTPKEFSSLKGVKGVTVGSVVGNESLFLNMNFKVAPWDNVKLRQAVAYAIDYDKLIKNAYYGQAKKWKSLVPSSYPGYSVPSTQYKYDLAKAKALLKESGYVDNGSLKLTYVAEKESTLGPVVTQIKADLKALGLDIQLDPLPQTQFGDRQLTKRDLPFAVNDQEKPIGVDAGYATYLFFITGGLNNMDNYSNKIVDDTYKAIATEPDTAKRNAGLATIQEQLAKDVAWVPVVEFATQWAYSSKVSGITWHPDNCVRFFDLKI
jgi:peptide/nickel transport system substrate-binding protein